MKGEPRPESLPGERTRVLGLADHASKGAMVRSFSFLWSLFVLMGSWSMAADSAAVFQHHRLLTTAKGPCEAFLWIPPDAEQIRGVVIGGMTLAERELAKDRRVREACVNEHLAVLFLKCGLGRVDVPKV
jgi:hypothetical protein